MNRINRKNCEAYFLDYYEGNLDAGAVADLFLFLEENSDLKNLFEGFDPVNLNDVQDIAYPNRASLYKKEPKINADNIHEWLIAEMEGELNLQQQLVLKSFLNDNPSFVRDRNLFRLTQLSVMDTENFEGKESLKKKQIRRYSLPPSGLWLSAAASLILLIGAWFVLRLNMNDAPQQASISLPHTLKDTSTVIKNALPVIEETSLSDKKEASIASANDRSTNNNSLQEKIKETESDQTFASQKNKSSDEQASPASIQIDTEPYETLRMRELVTAPANETALQGVYTEPASLIPPVPFDANETSGSSLMANNEEEQNVVLPQTNRKLPLKSKTIQFAANSVTKLSGNRLRIKTAFDPLNGNLAGYEVATANKKWQKQY